LISTRVWLFRVILLMLTALMVISWFMAWWSADIEAVMLYRAVIIHPWGLWHELGPLEGYAAGADMPGWFAYIMWAYLGLCVIALLYSMFVKEKVIRVLKLKMSLPQLLIGIAGLSYVIVVIVAVVFAAIRTQDFFSIKLVGETTVTLTGGLSGIIEARFEIGYWLAWTAGLMLIALALLRNKIIGRPRLNVK
jgi:hypothetical protein